MAYGVVSADLGGTLRLPAAYSGTVGIMASRVRPEWLHGVPLGALCMKLQLQYSEGIPIMSCNLRWCAGPPVSARPIDHCAGV